MPRHGDPEMGKPLLEEGRDKVASGPRDLAVSLPGYVKDDGSQSWYYARARTDADRHDSDHGGPPAADVRTTVVDGRGLAEPPTLDQHGLQLVPQRTRLSTADFYEEDAGGKIRAEYYPEMVEAIKAATGAAHVVVFHHQVRNVQKNTGDHKNLHTTVQGYAHGVHSDTHPRSAEAQFLSMAAKLEPQYRSGRYIYLNAWRNIR